LASAGRRSPLKGLQDSWMLSKDALQGSKGRSPTGHANWWDD
jgi:hypothetical protein